MNVQLIFPPQWIPYMPYLSLPALTAYLEERGIHCRQRDLNLESFDRLLTADRLKRYGALLSRRIAELEALDTISIEQYPLYEQLATAELHLPLVLERVEEAKSVLRSPDQFYRLDRHHWAFELLKRAFAIISLPHYPSTLNFWSFATRFNHFATSGLRSVADCPGENPYLGLFQEEFVPEILRDQPSLVGLSIVSDGQLAPAFTLIRALRRQAPELFIVVGGPYFSKIQKQLVEHPELFDEVNAYVMRDGEEPLHQLCQALDGGQGLESVPNLVWRDEGGNVRVSEQRVTNRINELPTPSFDGLPLDRYFSGETVLPLLSSHGCYWNKCRFCGSFHVYGHRFRMRGEEQVVKDMKALHHRYGCRHFHFSDEALPPAMAQAVSRAVREEDLPFRWFGEARFEKSFDRRRCAELAAGGCVKIKFGLESGSPKVLRLMNKGTDLDVARQVIAACREAGIAMHFFCMVGFPGETEADFDATRRFFLDQPEVPADPGFSFYCSVYGLDLGSDAALNPEILGLSGVRQVPGEELNMLLEFSAPGLPDPEELKKRQWDLILMVSDLIGHTKVPDEEAHGFLYLSHYHGDPPSALRAGGRRPVPQPLPLAAHPVRSAGLVTRRIMPWPAAASTITGIASTVTDLQVVPLHEESMEMLQLCDGRHSLGEILQHTAPANGSEDALDTEAKRKAAWRRIRIIEELLASGLLLLPEPLTEKEER